MSRYNKVGKVATKVTTTDEGTSVKYHNTIGVAFDRNHISLHHGGFRTATTKVRMNQAARQFDLGYSVCQEKHEWYCSYKGEKIPFDGNRVILRR